MNYLAIANSAQCDVSPFDEESNVVNVVITAPRGSACERKFDLATCDFLPGKILPQGVVFPFDYGFIPSTETPDGTPLEVMIFLEEPSNVGSIVPARLIGVIQSEETEGGRVVRKNRLLAVLETYYNPSRFYSLDELDSHLIATIEYFFTRKKRRRGTAVSMRRSRRPRSGYSFGRTEQRAASGLDCSTPAGRTPSEPVPRGRRRMTRCYAVGSY